MFQASLNCTTRNVYEDVGLAVIPRIQQKKVDHKAIRENVCVGRPHQAVFKFSFYIHSTNT